MNNADNLIHSFNSSAHSEGHFIGLTKKEHASILIMQGLLSNPNTELTVKNSKDYSDMAIDFADELLKQLEDETI